MTALLLYCRAGFEGECAAEITERASAAGRPGYCKAADGSGYVIFQPGDEDPQAADHLHGRLAVADLIFARQAFVSAVQLDDLPASDRVGALVAELAGAMPGRVAEVFVEHPDSEPGNQLAVLARKLGPPLRAALDRDGWRSASAALRLHVCLLDGHSAHLGYARIDRSAPWPMGIPRLKLPGRAPSRSARKLEEALHVFLGRDGMAKALEPGMTAVDLGAAPGGWSWLLTRRHLRVTAVDNGPMRRSVLDSGLVSHVRANGFHFRPRAPVDWMVCDMAERPGRVAELAASWLAEGWCRRALCNLKLPMTRRYAELQRYRADIRAVLDDAGGDYRLACKQLYHDREEVTVYLSVAE